MRGLVTSSLAILLLAAPEAARACSVCGFGQDGSRTAYLAMTALMSVLPLALFFGFVLYVRKRMRQIDAEPRAGAAEPGSGPVR